MDIINRIPVAVLLVLSASSVITGDYFAKVWSTERKPLFFSIALLGYFCSGVFYIPTLLRDGLVVTSIIWSLLSIIGFLAIGVLVFHETFSAWKTMGVVLGVAALLVFAWAH